jgi:hypothetical protein
MSLAGRWRPGRGDRALLSSAMSLSDLLLKGDPPSKACNTIPSMTSLTSLDAFNVLTDIVYAEDSQTVEVVVHIARSNAD